MSAPELNTYIIYKNSFLNIKKKINMGKISNEEAKKQVYAMYVNLKAIIDYNELIWTAYAVKEYYRLLNQLKKFIEEINITCENKEAEV